MYFYIRGSKIVAIYLLFSATFLGGIYLGKSFDILQDWGRDAQILLDFLSLMASRPSAIAFRQVVRSTTHVHTCAVTYLETTTFWKPDARTYFLLNRQMMEAHKTFLL